MYLQGGIKVPEVSVNTHLLKLSAAKDANDTLHWNIPIEGKDVLKILASRIIDPNQFTLNGYRYGEGTAADQPGSAGNQPEALGENATVTVGEEIEIAPFDVGPRKGKSYEYETVRDEAGRQKYRYLYFSVSYGENGTRRILHQVGGSRVDIKPEDIVSQRYHVFIGYVCDDDREDAILLTEAIGRNSVALPMKKVLRRLLKTIGRKNYVLKIDPLQDGEAVQRFITENPIVKIRFIKKAPKEENGQIPEYEQKELVYKYSARTRLNMDGPKRFLNKFLLSAGKTKVVSNNKEVDDFDADVIKFEVKGSQGIRTFTVGEDSLGNLKEVLHDVMGPDGITQDDKMLNEFKRIFEQYAF